MDTNTDLPPFEFLIIGAGIAGAKTFYHLSQVAPSLLIDSRQASHCFKSAKIVCAHDIPWMTEIPKDHPDIFLRDHWTSMYASQNIEAIVDGHEWGAPLGKIVDEQKLIQWYLDGGKAKKGTILWEATVSGIEIGSDNVTVAYSNNSGKQSIKAKMLILATGAGEASFDLLRQVGFHPPTAYNTVSALFEGTPEQINANLLEDYMYRLHPKISTTGMLWMNKGKAYFNIGYVSEEGQETPTEMAAKFLRILRNYAPIRQYFKGLSPDPAQMTPVDLLYGKGTRDHMSRLVSDHGRVIVVGDAGGLLYSLYYEGVIGAVASAHIAGEVLSRLFTQGEAYTQANLLAYDHELHRRLLDSYFKLGQVATEMFFMAGDKPPFTIWEAYLRAIKEEPQVRKNIWTAYRWEELGAYPEQNDAWVGQEIYKRLPLGKKIAFTPFFLKLKF